MFDRRIYSEDLAKVPAKLKKNFRHVKDNPKVKEIGGRLDGLRLQLKEIERQLNSDQPRMSDGSKLVDTSEAAKQLLKGAKLEELTEQTRHERKDELCSKKRILVKAVEMAQQEYDKVFNEIAISACSEVADYAKELSTDICSQLQGLGELLQEQGQFYRFLGSRGIPPKFRPAGWDEDQYEYYLLVNLQNYLNRRGLCGRI